MNVPVFLAATVSQSNQMDLLYIWDRTYPEGKLIICLLFVFSIIAWTVMITKALQMRRARKLNLFFYSEFKSQKNVLGIFEELKTGLKKVADRKVPAASVSD